MSIIINKVKQIFVISLVFLMLYKSVEPITLCLDFKKTAQSSVQFIENEDIITLKVYYPLPYSSQSHELSENQNLIKNGDSFYNIVEQRYDQDTFYLKIKSNLSARERFSALSDVVNELKSIKGTASKDQKSTKTTTIKVVDYIKPELPQFSATPIYIGVNHELKNNWAYFDFSSQTNIHIVSPPPDNV